MAGRMAAGAADGMARNHSAAELLGVLLGRAPPVALHVAQPERMLLVKGRGAISHTQRTDHDLTGMYSRHECVGDESSVKPRAQRVCLFQRVCLDTRSGEFWYHRRPDITRAPILFDRRYGHTFQFRHSSDPGKGEKKGGAEDFIGLNKHVRYKDHVRWSPRIVDQPIPAASVHVHTLTLLSAPFVPTNLGHLVWEEAFPLLLAMAQLGVYEPHADVLRTHGCNESVSGIPPSSSEVALCTKFVDGFLRPLQVWVLLFPTLLWQLTVCCHVCFGPSPS